MIKSMTAFGRAKQTVGGKDITIEIKSVNNRFFDCSTKLPRAFSFLEEKIKPYLQSRSISRGKVDVFVSIDVIDTPNVSFCIDEGYAASYISALRALGERFDLKDDISVMSVARNSDVFIIRKSEEDTEKDWCDLKVVLDQAIDKFLAARLKEGENICGDLKLKVENIKRNVETIEKLSVSDTVTYREKLEALGQARIDEVQSAFVTLCARLEGVNPLAVLSRGYSVLENERGEIVSSLFELEVGENVTVRLSDGSVNANITQKNV